MKQLFNALDSKEKERVELYTIPNTTSKVVPQPQLKIKGASCIIQNVDIEN